MNAIKEIDVNYDEEQRIQSLHSTVPWHRECLTGSSRMSTTD